MFSPKDCSSACAAWISKEAMTIKPVIRFKRDIKGKVARASRLCASRVASRRQALLFRELAQDCFVQPDPGLEIFEGKVLVRRVRAAIGERKSQKERLDAQDITKISRDRNAAAFANQSWFAIERFA